MKAIVQEAYGSAEVLELREIARPEIGDDELLLRVHAAGFEPGVWHIMAGRPYLVRVTGYGVRRPKALVPGNDVAGRVETVGSNVAAFRPGSPCSRSAGASIQTSCRMDAIEPPVAADK